MTAKGMFEALQIELAKQGAPSMLLSDFNYFANKAINQWRNKNYNNYETSQQLSDNLRVLKSTAKLPVILVFLDYYYDGYWGKAGPDAATYEVILPKDYLHILNCRCEYLLKKRHKCHDKGTHVRKSAKRLTADSWSIISENIFNAPSPENPYFYIHNVNNGVYKDDAKEPEKWEPIKEINYPYNSKTDMIGKYGVTINNKSSEVSEEISEEKSDEVLAGISEKKSDKVYRTNFDRIIEFNDSDKSDKKDKTSFIERDTAYRYGNPLEVRMEIRYGNDISIYELQLVYIDYLKTPLHIRLTLILVDLTEDTSLILEFPDDMCHEIINELVTLVMENNKDQRIQTFNAVTLSIATPAQQLAVLQKS